MALKKFVLLSDPDANGVRTAFQVIQAEDLDGRVHPDFTGRFIVAPAKVNVGWSKVGGAWLEPPPLPEVLPEPTVNPSA